MFMNISGYHFVDLDGLGALQERFKQKCDALALTGTIILAPEGINLMLAGASKNINDFLAFLRSSLCFTGIEINQSFSDKKPFKRLFVKVKKEIIPIALNNVKPKELTGQHLSPKEFKKWLDEKRDVTILDVRNAFEVEIGTFNSAIHLNLATFRHFPEAAKKLDERLKTKPLVMFCTGGVRCEKASACLMQEGFQEVYQLDGGILKYFVQCNGAYYQGECFVFDERIAVDNALRPTQRTGFSKRARGST